MPLDAPPIVKRRLLLDSLPAAARPAVGRLIEHCDTAQTPLHAVGGTIRDVLLGRPISDVDLAVEGDAIDAVYGAFPDARITCHTRFRTATLRTGGTRIDVVTARSETYARAGALPKVSPAGITDDMRRRDFSVNAIALRLDGEPVLIDLCGGIEDLRARRIRVLNDASFRDDATRMFRAFRYAARLRFDIEPHTRALIDDGIQHIASIGGERLRRELELLLADEPPGDALVACGAAGALGAIYAALSWSSSSSVAYLHSEIRAMLRDPEVTPFGFALLAGDVMPGDADAIVSRLRLKRDESAAVHGIAAVRPHVKTLHRPQAKPSGVVLLLERYSTAAVAAFVANNLGTIAGQVALRYLQEWRNVKPILSGRELEDMGVPTGPQIARGLQLLRAAKLDGWAHDRDDERALVLRFAKSIRDSDAMNASIDLQLDDN